MPNEALRPLLEAIRRSQREAGELLGNSEGLYVVCSPDEYAHPLRITGDNGRIALQGERLYLTSSLGNAERLATGFNRRLTEGGSTWAVHAELARHWVGRRIASLAKQEALLLSQVRSPA